MFGKHILVVNLSRIDKILQLKENCSMELTKYLRGSRVARRLEKADFVLKNINVMNVFTEEIYKADVAVADGMIAGIGEYEGLRELDMEGKYVCPGFIDSHLHLESTLVTPAELIYQAAQCGTTTFIVDPHESANVSGCAGIDYILDQTEEVPANVFVMLPSCVPATDMDDNGCVITADMMEPYLKNKRILGLGEVMDYSSVINGNSQMSRKLELFRDRIIDGHAPFLEENDLSAYAMAGIVTDHESTDYDYAMKERRRGMTVLIREGSAAKNLEAIVKGIIENQTDTSGFCFCTDDKHIEDIRKEGHINYNVKKAFGLGLDLMKAIKMATIQAAQCYGLKGLGAIAPGYQADLVIFEDIRKMKILGVYHKGKPVPAEEKVKIKPCDAALKNTVNIRHFSKTGLSMKKQNFPYHVIQMLEGQITTKDILAEIPGEKYFEPDAVYKKIAVVERYTGQHKTGVGVVTGYGITGGAIASSVSHDSHNIIVIGDNDEDMELAVNELIRTQGGYTIAEHGKIFETLELPIMGLMSDAGYETVNRKLSKMITKAHEMGVPLPMDPFLTLSFMALPVIPEIRITPRGVYRVTKEEMLVYGTGDA
jgi:adenine deaminase